MNNGHKHPLLANFDTHLRYLSRYYGPYCHSTIIKSLFDYVNGRIIEHEMEESGFNFPPTARLMPMFLRTKVGAAEILVSMMWPKAIFPEETYLMQYFPVIEELVLFIDFTNDILSYYKEFVIRQEKGNFVANFAETHDMTHLDVLRHLVAYTPQVCFLSIQQGLGREQMLTGCIVAWLCLSNTGGQGRPVGVGAHIRQWLDHAVHRSSQVSSRGAIRGRGLPAGI